MSQVRGSAAEELQALACCARAGVWKCSCNDPVAGLLKDGLAERTTNRKVWDVHSDALTLRLPPPIS